VTDRGPPGHPSDQVGWRRPGQRRQKRCSKNDGQGRARHTGSVRRRPDGNPEAHREPGLTTHGVDSGMAAAAEAGRHARGASRLIRFPATERQRARAERREGVRYWCRDPASRSQDFRPLLPGSRSPSAPTRRPGVSVALLARHGYTSARSFDPIRRGHFSDTPRWQTGTQRDTSPAAERRSRAGIHCSTVS
jgi:hypothetical protein